jgi:hypothetical protein
VLLGSYKNFKKCTEITFKPSGRFTRVIFREPSKTVTDCDTENKNDSHCTTIETRFSKWYLDELKADLIAWLQEIGESTEGAEDTLPRRIMEVKEAENEAPIDLIRHAPDICNPYRRHEKKCMSGRGQKMLTMELFAAFLRELKIKTGHAGSLISNPQ